MPSEISTEAAAQVVLDAVGEQLAGVPVDQHGRVMEAVLHGLAAEGLYDVAAAVMRTGKEIHEERVYGAIMALAGAHGHDEGMVFASIYEF